MPTPLDYETNPERFRLATRVTSQHLMAARSLYELLAEELPGSIRGASWTSAAGRAPCVRPCQPA
jgi:hypothetical protein